MDGVLPIFFVAVIGYFLGLRRVLVQTDAQSINKFVFMVCIPALSIHLIANAPFAKFDWMILVGFLISEAVIYLIGFVIARKVFKCELAEAVLLGLACSFGNHILFVLPIAISVFGEDATLPIVAIITVDSILNFGTTVVIMEYLVEKNLSVQKFLRNIFTNPPIVSLFLGILIALIGIDLSTGINNFLEFVGKAAAPCALFSLGIILSQIKLVDRLPTTIAVCVIKLLLHPCVAGLIFLGLLGISLGAARVPLMAAAAPCGAMAFVLALTYRVRTDVIGPAILVTTVASLATLSIVAGL